MLKPYLNRRNYNEEDDSDNRFNVINAFFCDDLLCVGWILWLQKNPGKRPIDNNWRGGLDITTKDFSLLTIINTTPYVAGSGGIGNLMLGGYSKTTISGGEINWIDLLGNATMTISGGKINNLQSGQLIETGYIKHVEVVCKAGYQYNTTTRKLTGVWGDNSTFTIQLRNDPESRQTIDNIKFTIIPEPMTLALLTLGGLLVRKK